MSGKKRNITVGLILGGISGERSVSLETGKAVYDALERRGFGVKLIDPALGKNQYGNAEEYWEKEIKEFSKKKFFEAFCAETFSGVDVAFIGLHGPYGEDGVTQTLLDLLGVPYVGSDAFASANGMNKYITKIIAEKYGVKFPEGILARKNDFDSETLKQSVKAAFGKKFVVKPNRQGSSLGLSVCESVSELENALDKGFAVDDELLIEEFIDGRELTVSILFGKALPVLEIIPESGLYDFEAKYETDSTRYDVPAKIEDEIAAEMQSAAEKVFAALGARDYARVDFRMRDREFYCLEINTLPGMTSHSLLPKAASAAGVEFDELIEKLISRAVGR